MGGESSCISGMVASRQLVERAFAHEVKRERARTLREAPPACPASSLPSSLQSSFSYTQTSPSHSLRHTLPSFAPVAACAISPTKAPHSLTHALTLTLTTDRLLVRLPPARTPATPALPTFLERFDIHSDRLDSFHHLPDCVCDTSHPFSWTQRHHLLATR